MENPRALDTVYFFRNYVRIVNLIAILKLNHLFSIKDDIFESRSRILAASGSLLSALILISVP